MTDSESSAAAADPVAGFFKLLFSFRGRIGRAQYWLGVAGAIAIAFAVLGIAAGANSPTGGTQLVVLIVPLLLLFVWVHLAVMTKRLRDCGFGIGGIILYALAPLIWFAVTLEFFEYIWGLIFLVFFALVLFPGVVKTKPAAD